MIRKHGILFLIALMIFPMSSLFSQVGELRAIENITFQKLGNQVEVSIEYDGDIPFESFMLFGPNRLAIDLPGVERVSSSPVVNVNEMGILSVRSALYSPGVVRVVLDFSGEIPRYKIQDSETGLKIFFWKEVIAESIPEKDVKPIEKKVVVIQPQQTVKMPLVQKTPPREIDEAKEDSPAKIDYEMRKVGVGVNVGYLALQDEVFQEVYGKGGAYNNAELSFVLPFAARYVDVWTGVSQFKADGKSTHFEEDTELKITVFSLALRYLIKSTKLTPFFGLGVDYYSYKETLPSGFDVPSVGGSDLGFHVQGGVLYRITPALFAKLLIKYNSAKTTENTIDVNLGGMEYALGLIFRFNLERN